MRLFVAINFTAETRNSLIALCDELRTVSSRGRFTLPENLHLTLAFIGECDTRQATAIKAAMDVITFEPFDLEIDRIGRYKRNGGDLWWAGVRENKALQELHQNLSAALWEAGICFDEKNSARTSRLGVKLSQRPRLGKLSCSAKP